MTAKHPAEDAMRTTPWTVLAILLAAGACMHRNNETAILTSLPAPVPPATGDVQAMFTMRYTDITAGTGAPAEAGKCFYVHYTGWLTTGTKFDSSHDTTAQGKPRAPLAFEQGKRGVIPGWDVGFEGMRVGGKRRLFIPYQLGYGERGNAPRIPPRATLVFDVELMDVRNAPAATRPPEPAARCAAF